MNEARGEKRRPVVFNLDREEDRALYAWLQSRPFSPLAKALLRAEMHRVAPRNTAQVTIADTPR